MTLRLSGGLRELHRKTLVGRTWPRRSGQLTLTLTEPFICSFYYQGRIKGITHKATARE